MSAEIWQGRTVDFYRGKRKNEGSFFQASDSLSGVMKQPTSHWRLVRRIKLPNIRVASYLWSELKERFPSLQWLDCSETIMFDEKTAVRISDCFPALQVLVVSWSAAISNESIRRTYGLPLRCLEVPASLDLHRLTLPFDSLPRLQDLEELNLRLGFWGSGKVDPAYLAVSTNDVSLAVLVQLPKLWRLNLSEVLTITDIGLGTLSRLPKLQVLILQEMGSGITSRGLDALRGGCASLRLLDLSSCAASLRLARGHRERTKLVQADIDRFKAARPRVEVLFS